MRRKNWGLSDEQEGQLQNGLEIALNRKKFGKAVKEKREREGLSLRDLEGVVGVSPNSQQD